MLSVCSPEGFVDVLSPRRGIAAMLEASITSIELPLRMFCPAHELEYMGKPRKKPPLRPLVSENPALLSKQAIALLEACQSAGLQIAILRAPELARDSNHHDLIELMFSLAKESIDVAALAGCKYLIVQALIRAGSGSNLWLANRDLYVELARQANKQGIMLLAENDVYCMNGHFMRGFIAEPEDAASLLDDINDELGKKTMGFSLDVGICHMLGQDMQHICHVLGDRLKIVTLRDTFVDKDSHLLPFTVAHRGQSNTDWLSLVRGLRDIGFDGTLTVSMRDTASALSPQLRKLLLPMAKSVGDFFAWQIEIPRMLRRYPDRVLFGAGRMCERYMRCYGEKYPPLFTVDNNPDSWGTKVDGLEVRSPASLAELPVDCAIIITNMYYAEIESQIMEMNIPNPIMRFNDEYLPDYIE